ncbi:MAG: glycosyl hydrolase [Proteobacteria bacterium]|nr:glycosyl hydrolase [Pseudomonadota bacterium]
MLMPTRPSKTTAVTLLVATRKGAWFFHGDAARRQWRAIGPHFLGSTIHHLVMDPRDGKTAIAAASTGHLGSTIFRSADRGKTWKESSAPPAFPRLAAGELDASGLPARTVKHTFWLTPGHVSQPGVWFAGTSPQAIFRSDDAGDTWQLLPGLHESPQYRDYMGDEQGGTPDGPKMHSILIDPRDAKHMYMAMSSGGVHESRNGGRSWSVLIDGMAVVEGFDATKASFHDPHCVRLCPSNPDRLYQQNHCGIYRLDRPAKKWVRIGDNMPKTVGDVGFPMVVHPRNADIAWVMPMNGTMVWPRTAPQGKPAVYVTRNGGAKWLRQDAGMPRSQAWWTVKRQAMTNDTQSSVGLYFGTTSGELWSSRDEGKKWTNIARHLPEIYAVEVAER